MTSLDHSYASDSLNLLSAVLDMLYTSPVKVHKKSRMALVIIFIKSAKSTCQLLS